MKIKHYAYIIMAIVALAFVNAAMKLDQQHLCEQDQMECPQ